MPTQEELKRKQINDDHRFALQLQAQEFDKAGGYNHNGQVKFTAAEQSKLNIANREYGGTQLVNKYSQYLQGRDNATRSTINNILGRAASRAGRSVEEEVALQRALLNSFEEQKSRPTAGRTATPPPPRANRGRSSSFDDADPTRFRRRPSPLRRQSPFSNRGARRPFWARQVSEESLSDHGSVHSLV